MENRNTGNFTLRLTNQDRGTLEAAAKVVGWPLGAFVRRAALAVAGRHLNPPVIAVGGDLVPLLTDLPEENHDRNTA